MSVVNKIQAKIIAPNNDQNEWKIPLGVQVILGDGQAYYIAPASVEGRTEELGAKIKEVRKLFTSLTNKERIKERIASLKYDYDPKDDYSEQIAKLENELASLEQADDDMIDKISYIARLALSYQYSDETVENLFKNSYVNSQNYNTILQATEGSKPDYEIVPKNV